MRYDSTTIPLTTTEWFFESFLYVGQRCAKRLIEENIHLCIAGGAQKPEFASSWQEESDKAIGLGQASGGTNNVMWNCITTITPWAKQMLANIREPVSWKLFFFQFSDSIVVSFDSHECGIVRNIWNKLHRAGMKQIAMGKDWDNFCNPQK